MASPMQSPERIMDLDKVIKLFLDPNSQDLHERHTVAVQRLCEANVAGFPMRDLPKTQHVLELTLGLLRAGFPEYLEPACQLLRTLAKPFVKLNSTDEVRLLDNVSSLLAAMGAVFQPYFAPELHVLAAQMLVQFATAYGSRPSALELASATGGKPSTAAARQFFSNQGLVAKSGVVKAVADDLAYAVAAELPDVADAALRALIAFSPTADCCSTMVASGVPSHLNALLRRPHGDPVVTLAVELLWNILDYCPDSLPVIASQGLWTYEDGVAQPPPPAGAEAAQAAAPPQGVGLPPISEMSLGPLAEESTMAAYSEPSYAAPQDGGGGGPDAAAGTEQPGAQEPDGGARASTTSTIDLTALSEQAAQLANTLTRLLKALVLEGRKTSEKELRNDVLVAINLLMDDNAFKVAFWAAGLFTTVAVISVCPENGDSSSVIRSYALTTDEHDFELKQLAWAAVAKGCELQDVLQLAQQFGLMNVLLMYQQLPGSPTVTRWMPDQRATLQSVALSKLYVLAALAPQAYLAAKGLAMTTALLQDGGSQDVHVEAALRHLHNLCGLLPSVTKELVQERMVTRLLDLAMEPRHSSQLRHFAVLLLARLCGDDAMGAEEARRWVRRAGGVQRLLGELAAVVAQHALLPSPYVISLLDAVWAAVVPDRKSQAMFLVEGGLDTLLSMLERSAKGYRPVLLSMVADILENPKSHEFFFEWESDADQRNACRLLVGLWRDEDAARGMSADGVLANAVRPLAGLQSRTTWLPSEEVAYGSLSASRRQELEVVSSGVQGDAMLCKIYAVFALVGFDAVRSQLDARDQAVLAFIEQFVKFKQGEVWMDMKEEFGAAGMKPTETDVERLESGIESAQELARRLQEAQEALVNSHMDVARQAEASMFESMRAQREIDDQIRRLGPDSVIRAAQPTWKDISEAKAKKEAMLRASLHMHSTAAHADQDGGDDRPAHFDTAAVSLPLPAFGTGPLPPQTISPVPGHEASSGSSGKFVVPSLALNRVKSQ